MSDGFPLLTTKKIYWKGIVTELLWFLRGDTNIKYLVDNDCHIWDGDAYKAYGKWVDGENKKGKEDAENLRRKGILVKQYYISKLSQEEFINKIKTDDEFAKKWGELGPIYGKQWRSWEAHNKYDIDPTPVDQIANLINDLKTNPDSRRLMVNAWNVGELDQMVLPPCHYGFQMYTRELSLEEKEYQLEKTNCINDIENDRIIYGHEWEKYIQEQYEGIQSNQGIKIPTRAISLIWNQRSVDTFLGLPFNIASYGLLLEIIAKEVNMIPDELIGNLGDVHLYSNHIEQAREQIGRKLTVEERMDWWFRNHKPNRDVCDVCDTYSPYAKNIYFNSVGVPKTTREPYPLPTVTLPSSLQPDSGNWDKLVFEDFYLNNYQSHPTLKAPLSN
jgi:thymidylate synthase